ncbi:OmpA family protein [Piscinibacter sp. XHJ-5]|uniref:OmpA family protein n=1 Tax=Piscinibacter sp. XHJ-5 TaxID=3037797 RepID=UPI002452CDCE|nr:OmpA family protein [Piscinibacter sp. XHJ-5]
MARRFHLASLLLALAAGSALAQDVRLYGAGESVDPREVAGILDQSRPMKMRSIRLLDDTPSAQTAQQPQDASRIRSSALALPVQFAFDSAEIQPSARPQLDALAEGIRMLPTIQSIVIEGHTDAVGSEAYNEQLSQRRAQAVKRYLVASHGIDAARLRAVGLGEFAPLQGRDPNASENRRVQFRGE